MADINQKSRSTYSSSNKMSIKTLFEQLDSSQTGFISITEQLPSLLQEFGKYDTNIIEKARESYDAEEISFNQLVDLLEAFDQGEDLNEAPSTSLVTMELVTMELVTRKYVVVDDSSDESPEQKVLEFLRILDEYRKKCESEGNYKEAERAHKQLTVLRKQEEKRQQRVVISQQETEKLDIQKSHNIQIEEFNIAWDKYLDEYDSMAQQYILQMTERHAKALVEIQGKLREDIVSKPPKWSKELIEQRRKQFISARNRNYREAEELKKICDGMR